MSAGALVAADAGKAGGGELTGLVMSLSAEQRRIVTPLLAGSPSESFEVRFAKTFAPTVDKDLAGVRAELCKISRCVSVRRRDMWDECSLDVREGQPEPDLVAARRQARRYAATQSFQVQPPMRSRLDEEPTFEEAEQRRILTKQLAWSASEQRPYAGLRKGFLLEAHKATGLIMSAEQRRIVTPLLAGSPPPNVCLAPTANLCMQGTEDEIKSCMFLPIKDPLASSGVSPWVAEAQVPCTAFSAGILPINPIPILPCVQHKVSNDDGEADVMKKCDTAELQFALITSITSNIVASINIVISSPAMKSHFL